MTLNEAKTGSKHRITACNVSGKTLSRLDCLGLVTGETVHVLSASFAGLIVEIKGSRLAICHDVARHLEVE